MNVTKQVILDRQTIAKIQDIIAKERRKSFSDAAGMLIAEALEARTEKEAGK